MLIPSIDLQNGHIVQLVQGETLAIQTTDPEPWIERFSRFPRVQLIDLDAAMGRTGRRGPGEVQPDTVALLQEFGGVAGARPGPAPGR